MIKRFVKQTLDRREEKTFANYRSTPRDVLPGAWLTGIRVGNDRYFNLAAHPPSRCRNLQRRGGTLWGDSQAQGYGSGMPGGVAMECVVQRKDSTGQPRRAAMRASALEGSTTRGCPTASSMGRSAG